MTITNLLEKINQAENIQAFAQDNLLKLVVSGDGRYILTYDEIYLETPKNWVSHYCRGLTLAGTPNNYIIIAKSFNRFYDLDENPNYIKDDYNIDFTKPFYVDFKYDGSLILLYFWDGEWRVNTRGSFAQGKVSNICSQTWSELFWEGFDSTNINNLDKGLTYIYELCSPHNHVVEYYRATSVSHLSTMGCDGKEVYKCNPNNICNSLEDVNQKLSELTATQEGFVLVQWNEEKKLYARRKLKTQSWLALSSLKASVGVTEYKLWDIIFRGNYSDVVAVFPHLAEPIARKEKQYKDLLVEIQDLYNEYKDIENKKDFAMAIKDNKYKGILFGMRTGNSINIAVQEYMVRNFLAFA